MNVSFFHLCQVSMGLTVRTTLMTAPVIIVPMEEPVWTESTPTTASALQSGLVRNLCVQLFTMQDIRHEGLCVSKVDLWLKIIWNKVCCLRYLWDMNWGPGSLVGITDPRVWRLIGLSKHSTAIYVIYVFCHSRNKSFKFQSNLPGIRFLMIWLATAVFCQITSPCGPVEVEPGSTLLLDDSVVLPKPFALAPQPRHWTGLIQWNERAGLFCTRLKSVWSLKKAVCWICHLSHF